MRREEALLREYETITAQIVHWDSHFWRKSQFFVLVEAGSLAVVARDLMTRFAPSNPMHWGVFLIVDAAALLNTFLCYVWFRTNRRNEVYVNVRFNRARQIENDWVMQGVLRLYHVQDGTVSQDPYKKQRSRPWERHLPTAFILAWAVILGLAFFLSRGCLQGVVASVTVVFAAGGIFVVEKTGWPQQGGMLPV